jgi:hypothetical protein
VNAKGAVQVLDRDAAQRAKPAVDAADDLVHLRGEPLVLRHVRARGHGNLHEQHAVAPLRVLAQELLEPQQLLGNTFDHVQPVHAEHHLAPLEPLAQLVDVRLHALRLQRLREPPGVDPDGKRRDAREVAVVLHALRRALEPQNARARADEVPGVVVGVEPDEVGGEHRQQELLAHRQHAVNLRGRERRVQEPTHLHGRVLVLQTRRQEHQMVVVAPHRVSGLVRVQDDAREELVGLLVRFPLQTHVFGFAQLALERERHVVEQRPQDVVAVPVVVQVHLRAAEVYG